jgi:hypothetical protein
VRRVALIDAAWPPVRVVKARRPADGSIVADGSILAGRSIPIVPREIIR